MGHDLAGSQGKITLGEKKKFPNCCCAWWKCRIALVLFEQWKTTNSVFPIQSHQSQIGTCLPRVLLTYLCWVALCSEENDKLESRYSNKPKNCSTEKDKKHGPKPHSGILACFAATSLVFFFSFEFFFSLGWGRETRLGDVVDVCKLWTCMI